MATKNHKQSMSQPERNKWWDAFLQGPILLESTSGLDERTEASIRADFADAAIAEYRKRVIWGQS
jgi:hypothetical protein